MGFFSRNLILLKRVSIEIPRGRVKESSIFQEECQNLRENPEIPGGNRNQKRCVIQNERDRKNKNSSDRDFTNLIGS